ncbi:SNF2-related protein [Bradyrhizobium sp. ARR65]|uniref:SNF2-related protein n=1 Tax=Bradyrhizobium sp. ARR65 TaxID=1040989 RepID=UPI000AB54524|nr:SNF2-related protein [Bradyrhizobium sp. ARR65]
MPVTEEAVRKLCARLRLGTGHELQEHAVRSAISGILVDQRKGVVLADEVGFGKTYEALAIMALLCEHSRAAQNPFERVLILCKSTLLEKWQEELSRVRPDRGFARYLMGEAWPEHHPVFRLLDAVHVIGRRAAADDHRSIREGGKLQAAPGIYIVNHHVLTEANRNSRWFLKRLYETEWDLVIIDEAHHYARWTRPAYIFAPNGDMTDYNQGLSGGRFANILALTATPFELTPHEIVQLLALIRADKGDLQAIRAGLDQYVRELDAFFALRERSVTDPLRLQAVRRLNRLRDHDAVGDGTCSAGLQALLRRYMIRNTKSENERRYYFVNRAAGQFRMQRFNKLDDLRRTIKDAPLLPFEGPDALFYLELRELIDETIEQAREGNDNRTFVTTDLRQGLSSYPQLARSKLLNRNLDSAKRLKRLVDAWNSGKHVKLHPKVDALADLVEAIALHEIEKVSTTPGSWFSKILVFNKLIGGTAPHLRDVLTKRLTPIFVNHLEAVLRSAGIESRASFAAVVRSRMRSMLSDVKKRLKKSCGEMLCTIPYEFQHEDFRDYRGKPIVDAYQGTLLRRIEQPLFLLRAINQCDKPDDESIDRWLFSEVVGPFEETVRRIVVSYAGAADSEDGPNYELLDMAEHACLVLLQECSAVDIVGRYDGDNVRYREAHRRNFNQLFNPFVLLVSRVGEEGIDLQQQCRYIVHYDLEWNPAKMEQREGRVDRVGWGRSDEGYIDVRFMLLKGTYEERIFHAVMQRDQWFQVLIGAKRNELGRADDDEAADRAGDVDEEPVDIDGNAGQLSPQEKAAVMMDLRPQAG